MTNKSLTPDYPMKAFSILILQLLAKELAPVFTTLVARRATMGR